MAYDIGPRISIKGDSEFKQQLNSINNQLKEYGSEVKKIDSEEKANGATKETQAKKLKALQGQYDAQSKKLKLYQSQLKKQEKVVAENKAKLDALKNSQSASTSEIQKAERAYNASVDSVSKLKTAINETETYVNKLKTAMSENTTTTQTFSENMQAAGEALTQTGQSLTDTGVRMSAMSAAVGAFGKKSTDAFLSVDHGLDIVTIKTGASGEALEKMKNQAYDLANKLGVSFDDAGTAIGEVNTRFGLTGQKLEKLSGQFLKFARVNETDVNTSIDMVQKSLSAYGLEAEDASGVLDKLNQVGQQTGVSMETLQTALVNSGGAFQAMGLDIYQSIEFIGAVEKSGADTTTVINGLNRAVANAASEGKSAKEAFSDLQKQYDACNSDTEKLNMLTELFGTRAGPKLKAALDNGSLSFANLSKKATKANGSLDDVFKRTDKSGRKIQKMKIAMTTAMSSIGESLMETLLPALQMLASILLNVSKFIDSLPGPIKTIISVILIVIAVIGPLTILMGSIITNVGVIMTAIGTLLPLLGGAVTALLPFAPIIIGIIAAIAAIILIVKNWGTITQWFGNLWNSICDFASQHWNNFKDAISNGIQAIQSWLQSLGNWFTNLFNQVTQFGSNVANAIGNVANTIKTTFKNIIDSALNWGKDLIDNFINGIQQKIGKLTKSVKGVAQIVKDFLGFSEPKEGPLSNFHTFAPDMIDLFVKGISDNQSRLVDAVAGLAGGMANTIHTAGDQTTLNNTTYVTLDGRLIYKAVDKRATTDMNSSQVMRGRR